MSEWASEAGFDDLLFGSGEPSNTSLSSDGVPPPSPPPAALMPWPHRINATTPVDDDPAYCAHMAQLWDAMGAVFDGLLPGYGRYIFDELCRGVLRLQTTCGWASRLPLASNTPEVWLTWAGVERVALPATYNTWTDYHLELAQMVLGLPLAPSDRRWPRVIAERATLAMEERARYRGAPDAMLTITLQTLDALIAPTHALRREFEAMEAENRQLRRQVMTMTSAANAPASPIGPGSKGAYLHGHVTSVSRLGPMVLKTVRRPQSPLVLTADE